MNHKKLSRTMRSAFACASLIALHFFLNPAAAAPANQPDQKTLSHISGVVSRPFSGQAVQFLNAYWSEVGSDAEVIYSVHWDMIKRADMRAQGVSLPHLYTEGKDLDFDMGLYFYEQLGKFFADPKSSTWGKNFPRSRPENMTALNRKQQLREKVDVNADGRISFLEYLLQQYKDVASPSDFVRKSKGQDDEPTEIKKARLALEEVDKRIRTLETERNRLETQSNGTGTRALAARNQLAQIASSPLSEDVKQSLIKADASVRLAAKKFGVSGSSQAGAAWWYGHDLEEKKKRYN